MTWDVSPLFETLTVRDKVLRNRIVMPPMVVLRDLRTPEGVRWYARRAQGGAALVIVESTGVDRFGPELTAENLKPLVAAVHDAGALIAIQLFPVARGRSVTPVELTLGEIGLILEDYRRATEICQQAGFDGIEPHGAHGYLLNQFFSPVQNQRTDAYGGSLEKCMQMARQIVQTVRAAASPSTLVLYRHSPVREDLGYGIAESYALAEALVAAGVDILDLSPSSHEAPGDWAAPFTALGVPVIAVGRLDQVDRALEVLDEGRADLVAVGRGLIADPSWPAKVSQGRFDEIVACVRCDGCHADLHDGVPVGCTQWDEEP